MTKSNERGDLMTKDIYKSLVMGTSLSIYCFLSVWNQGADITEIGKVLYHVVFMI